MDTCYATREAVKAALSVSTTRRTDAQVDSALRSGSLAVDSLTKRRFRPLKTTYSYDWPNRQHAPSWTLWLDRQPDQLIEVTSVVSGGVTLTSADYILRPANLGPPYNGIEINLGTGAAFSSGSSTWQNSILIAGTWGHRLDWTTLGATAEALTDTETDLDVTAAVSALVGVGDLLSIDGEYMNVTARRSLSTGQTTTAALDADYAVTLWPVSDGTAFAAGEMLTLDGERVYVDDILGNSLSVVRAQDGTALATHASGSTLYASRTLIVERAVRGTTAATHLTAATVLRHDVPALVAELAAGEALNVLLSRQSGWARTVGAGDSEQEASGRGLAQLRKQVQREYGRNARSGAI